MRFKTFFISCFLIADRFSQNTTYRDPLGRFHIDCPLSWRQMSLSDDGVEFVSGNAFVILMAYPGSNWNAVLNRVSTEVGGQYHNFTVVNRGPFKVDGRPGAFVTSTGINPQGVDSFLTVVATDDGENAYVLMASCPRGQYQALQPVFRGMIESFCFGAKERSRSTAIVQPLRTGSGLA
ncbi:MAG TPA: hypothetical protein VKU01_29095 [Bryobacteraceae bacterium]|nr:hypothetical protein [Bryobacteraceae bacterium]